MVGQSGDCCVSGGVSWRHATISAKSAFHTSESIKELLGKYTAWRLASNHINLVSEPLVVVRLLKGCFETLPQLSI